MEWPRKKVGDGGQLGFGILGGPIRNPSEGTSCF